MDDERYITVRIMYEDIFDNRMQKILDMIKGIPRLYNYVISLSPDFLKNYLSYFESNFDFKIRSDTIAEIKLKNKGGSSDEEWTYNFAEPYPGISIMCGNIKGLEKLNGMTGTDEDMKVSVIHYCRRGRCELHTHDGRFAFSRPGVMCLESRKYKKKDFNFFGEDYNSIEIAFRLDEIDEDSRDYLSGLGIDIAGMQANYEADADFRIGNVSDKLKAAEEELAELMESDNVDNTTLFLMVLRINNLITAGNLITDEKKFYLTKGQRNIVSEIRSEIDNNPDKAMTVEGFSEKYGISVVSLNKYFSIMYGDTIHKYIQKYRMRHAAETLRNTDKSISEIAAASGYENQGKFGGIFKRIYGMTPMEYRRQNKCEKSIKG